MSDEEQYCQAYEGDHGLTEDGDCGLPATEIYKFDDGSGTPLCAKHWEEWVTEDEEELAEVGRESARGQEILDTWRLNGISN